MPTGVCKNIAKLPMPATLPVQSPTTFSSRIAPSLALFASPFVVTETTAPSTVFTVTMRCVTYAPFVRKVTMSPFCRDCFSSSSRMRTKMSAPSAKLSASSPSIDPVVTAMGATPNTSGGTSGSMLPLMIRVRLIAKIGTRMTARTIRITRLAISPFVRFFFSFASSCISPRLGMSFIKVLIFKISKYVDMNIISANYLHVKIFYNNL